jgi:hypothetical protein
MHLHNSRYKARRKSVGGYDTSRRGYFEKKYVHPNNDRAIYYRFDDSGTIQYHKATS